MTPSTKIPVMLTRWYLDSIGSPLRLALARLVVLGVGLRLAEDEGLHFLPLGHSSLGDLEHPLKFLAVAVLPLLRALQHVDQLALRLDHPLLVLDHVRRDRGD